MEDRGESQPGDLVSLSSSLVPPLAVVRHHLSQDEGDAALLVRHQHQQVKEGSEAGELTSESLLTCHEAAHHPRHHLAAAAVGVYDGPDTTPANYFIDLSQH